ncbi:hypothetical protein LOTGIDRAFT_236612 [Lottia gigantea]|uniref:Uncharacterized protein n=1 Tax=Lottia gigantea TaxID=225164 RepID=V4B4W3_LOTGI|nr:hypothetical protein LOTGIDRAFT_236612 [Lottia gigantea]ESO83469.1 hypothetical protein LOTGIDRAFT_236612 [Lottia gigantea]
MNMNSNMSTVIEDQGFQSEDILRRRLAPYVTFGLQDLQTLMRLDGNTPNSNLTNQLNLKEVVENIFKPKISTEKTTDVVVNGAEHNDVPIEYTIRGLKSHELPVKGVYVHGQIAPGFPYKVRYNGSEKYMFGGEARCLQSIGMGYGKRLTFTGDTLNDKDCYFWSDSHPEGFAFNIAAVKQNEKFIILNSLMEPIGEAVVNYVNEDQHEESSEVVNGVVTKKVRVTLQCSVNFSQKRYHGLVDLHQTNFETINGTALLTKQKRERKAKLDLIENVFLGNFGTCSLHKKS